MPSPNRYSTWFAGQLRDWDITSGGPYPFPDLRYFADVMVAFDDQVGAAGLHVLATDDTTGSLPVTGPDVVVLCLNDEFGRSPAYAFDVRLVAKTMGGSRRPPYVAVWPPQRWPTLPAVAAQELVVALRRLPNLARALAATVHHRRRPPVLAVPSGIRAYYERPHVPFEQRAFDVTFAGSLVNEPGEERRRPLTQKVRFRRDFLAALDAAQARRPDLRFRIRTVPSHWGATQDMGVYLDELSQTRIALCPRGSSLHTYRFYEAVRFGCVPVYEKEPAPRSYRGAPAVRCRDWTRLPDLLDRLLADPAGLRERHEAALRWYDEHAAPPAVGARIAAAVSPLRPAPQRSRRHP